MVARCPKRASIRIVLMRYLTIRIPFQELGVRLLGPGQDVLVENALDHLPLETREVIGGLRIRSFKGRKPCNRLRFGRAPSGMVMITNAIGLVGCAPFGHCFHFNP